MPGAEDFARVAAALGCSSESLIFGTWENDAAARFYNQFSVYESLLKKIDLLTSSQKAQVEKIIETFEK